MDAAQTPLLTPGEDLLAREPPRQMSDDLGRALLLLVEAPPHEVAPGGVHREREVEVAALLARKPRVAPQPAQKIARHRFRLVDRKQGVLFVAHQARARAAVLETCFPEHLPAERHVGALLV